MIFFYPIKDGTHENPELKYSVRSVAKLYPDAEIWLAGKRYPSWANKSVNLMYFNERNKIGAANVWEKLLKFAEKHDKFILMNDDIFINKHYDITARHFYDTDLAERLKGTSAYYARRIQATISYLLATKGTQRCYDIHQPFYLEADQIKWLSQHLIMKRDYLFKSILGNMDVLPSIKAVHCKLTTPKHFNENMIYFSCNDAFMQDGGLDLLQSLWSEKCKFEK